MPHQHLFCALFQALETRADKLHHTKMGSAAKDCRGLGGVMKIKFAGMKGNCIKNLMFGH